MENKNLNRRIWVLLGCLVAIFFGLGVRLVDLQVVNGDEYREMAQRKISRTYEQPASRGAILDRYGRPLVSNSMGFAVTFTYFDWESETGNDTILKIVDLLTKAGIPHRASLPVSLQKPYNYTFVTGDENEKNLNNFLDKRKKWPKNPNASDLIKLLRNKYDVVDEMTDEQARIIIGVRYEMELREFSSYNNVFTLATDVSVETVSKIEERSFEMPGVAIATDDVREYNTTAGAHILGRVGMIYKDEYAELKAAGYPMDAIIGKDGAEKAFEKYLRGVDGRQAVQSDVTGAMLGNSQTQAAKPGNNVALTLDLDLQTVAEKSLESTIEQIRIKGRNSRKNGADAKGGAAVVIDVNTGGILACVSYPTYNLQTFNADYKALYEDPLTPMVNRAIAGAYPPGSTFKPVTALAVLESGTVEPNTIIRDEGVYNFYKTSGASSYTPACWLWNQSRRTHGNVDVSGALKYSCNYFFYETSRIMGIETLNKYAKKLGLGEKTGVELAGEARGNLAGPESRKEKDGAQWQPGETIQAAIGQSDQQFTPIQMASYMATIVNGGTYYKPHFLKNIMEYSYGSVVQAEMPEVVEQLDLKPSTIEAIKEGMRGVVTDDGTAASIFRNYPIAIGGKTGSAQTSFNKLDNKSAHGVFISFAPYDVPQIAVFVIVENGGSGGNVAPVVRDIYDAYFSKAAANNVPEPENTLIA